MTHEAGEKDKTIQVQISLPFCFLIVYVHNMLLGSDLDFDPCSISFNWEYVFGNIGMFPVTIKFFCRQRDKMVLILEEFSTVQEEADKIDNMLNTLSLQVRISSFAPFLTHILSWVKKYQCCGSRSVGSVRFWASWIRIYWSEYGSGSGSGSFYHQAKIVRKTLIPTAL
jgi:hypothetical protein